jgi:hypothetical protein
MMNTTQQLSEHEFALRLTPETVRTFQIIQTALMTGATMFLLVILMLHMQGTSGETSETEVLDILSMVHAVFALSAFGASKFIFEKDVQSRDDRQCTDPYHDITQYHPQCNARAAGIDGRGRILRTCCLYHRSHRRTHTDRAGLFSERGIVCTLHPHRTADLSHERFSHCNLQTLKS